MYLPKIIVKNMKPSMHVIDRFEGSRYVKRSGSKRGRVSSDKCIHPKLFVLVPLFINQRKCRWKPALTLPHCNALCAPTKIELLMQAFDVLLFCDVLLFFRFASSFLFRIVFTVQDK